MTAHLINESIKVPERLQYNNKQYILILQSPTAETFLLVSCWLFSMLLSIPMIPILNELAYTIHTTSLTYY